ncbi:MAG: hypothetical protein EOM73_04610 [Bacteroidia bacterium]|nr:hypothetical protein [Bacteroidia bacterium]
MTEKKEQKIVVFLSLAPSDKTLILNGIKIASIFRKELCLLYNYPGSKKKFHTGYQSKLMDYTQPIRNEIPGLKVSTLLLSEPVCELPEKLSDELEAIFLIAPSSKFSAYSKAVTRSPVPFLFVNETLEKVPVYNKLVLPVDLRKENEDSVMWSSYFGRFSGAEIVVVAAGDQRKENQEQVTRNVMMAKKLFRKFNIVHKIYKGEHSSLRNGFEALELALHSNADLLVILGSSVITPLDLLVGLPERKIIKKAGKLPVLMINPRKDNYILCD